MSKEKYSECGLEQHLTVWTHNKEIISWNTAAATKTGPSYKKLDEFLYLERSISHTTDFLLARKLLNNLVSKSSIPSKTLGSSALAGKLISTCSMLG